MNTNIQHQGKTLHIQTEDSGSEHPHIITHLFLAGQILVSERLDYSNHISADNLQQIIKEQHHEMLRAVQAGHFDKKILLARPKKTKLSDIPLARKKVSSPQKSVSRQTNVDETMEEKEALSSLAEKGSNQRIGGPWAIPRISERPKSLQKSKEE